MSLETWQTYNDRWIHDRDLGFSLDVSRVMGLRTTVAAMGPAMNLALAAMAFAILCFYLLHPILAPFVVGALIAYLGDPLVDWLEQHKLNRAVSVSLVFVIFTVALILALLVFVPAYETHSLLNGF